MNVPFKLSSIILVIGMMPATMASAHQNQNKDKRQQMRAEIKAMHTRVKACRDDYADDWYSCSSAPKRQRDACKVAATRQYEACLLGLSDNACHKWYRPFLCQDRSCQSFAVSCYTRKHGGLFKQPGTGGGSTDGGSTDGGSSDGSGGTGSGSSGGTDGIGGSDAGGTDGSGGTGSGSTDGSGGDGTGGVDAGGVDAGGTDAGGVDAGNG